MARTRTSRRRPRSPRGEGEDLRDEILDAAERLLIDTGSMDDVSVRAIVDSVGVTPPALYLHFEDKTDLFFEVCQRRFADFERALVAAAGSVDDPMQRLRALGRAYIRYGVENGEHYQLLFGPRLVAAAEGRDLTDTPGMRAFLLLVDLIRDGVDQGRFRDVDPYEASFAVWSSVHGAVMIVLAKAGLGESFPVPDVDAMADQIGDLVESGLAARPGA